LQKSKIRFLAQMHQHRKLIPSLGDLLFKALVASIVPIEFSLQSINQRPDS
jgi:hypothetical protein